MLLTLLVIVIYGTVWGWDSETEAETKDEDEDERIRRGTCHVASGHVTCATQAAVELICKLLNMSPDNQCLKFDIDESPTQNWHDNYQEDKDRERDAALEWERERERGQKATGDILWTHSFERLLWAHLLTTACRVLTRQHVCHVHVQHQLPFP